MGVPLSIDEWRKVVEGDILEEWKHLEWPNGIGLEFDEAASDAERILGKGPVEIAFDQEAFEDVLNDLEEELARRNGQETHNDW